MKTIVSSPRVAAHKERTAQENLITKKAVIKNLEKQLDVSTKIVQENFDTITELRNRIDNLENRIMYYQSTKWRVRAWMLICELFGKSNSI